MTSLVSNTSQCNYSTTKQAYIAAHFVQKNVNFLRIEVTIKGIPRTNGNQQEEESEIINLRKDVPLVKPKKVDK